MPESAADTDVGEDALLGGRVRLLQPRRGHRAGTDAVLLAALSGARAGDHIVDLGSASGAVGLMIAARVETARLTFIDRDETLIALARENISLNGLADRARALCLDVFSVRDALPGAEPLDGAADLVATNPPFFDDGERASPNPGRRSAHVMEGGSLSGWVAAAARFLKPRGMLVLIHRSDRLAGCLDAVRVAFGGLTITPIHPRAGSPASRILISAVKGAAQPLKIAPSITLHRPDGTFTSEAEALHRPLA